MAIYRCQAASQVPLFVGFSISSISLPTKPTKIGTPRSDFTVIHNLFFNRGMLISNKLRTLLSVPSSFFKPNFFTNTWKNSRHFGSRHFGHGTCMYRFKNVGIYNVSHVSIIISIYTGVVFLIKIVNYLLWSCSRKSRSPEDSMAIYRCQAASQVPLFVGFLISWISLPTWAWNVYVSV
jgi:hypothetical protein